MVRRVAKGPRLMAMGLLAMVPLGLVSCSGPDGPSATVPPPPSSTSDAPSPDALRRTDGSRIPTEFESSVARLDRQTRRQMTGVTWRSECPVRLRELRLLTMSFRDYDGDTRTGRMVVHRDVASDVVDVFARLYRQKFPIRRMELVDRYGGSDRRSIAANNTSAFNCRPLPGSSTWSEHAYGQAVDINPVQNPYWRPGDGYVEPRRGRRFIDRTRRHQGLIREGGVVVQAFDRIGWSWGGRWQSLKDWQHFSLNGR